MNPHQFLFDDGGVADFVDSKELLQIKREIPAGDNMVGGLTAIEEKSMGAVKKCGSKPVVGYLDVADRPGD